VERLFEKMKEDPQSVERKHIMVEFNAQEPEIRVISVTL